MTEAEEPGGESATGTQLPSTLSVGPLLPSLFFNGQLPSPALSQLSGTSSSTSEWTSEESSRGIQSSESEWRSHDQSAASVMGLQDTANERGHPPKPLRKEGDAAGTDAQEGSLSKNHGSENEKNVLKLSPDRVHLLTSSVKSLPLHVAPPMTPLVSVLEKASSSGQRRTSPSDAKDGNEGRTIAGTVGAGVVHPTEPRAAEPRLPSLTAKDAGYDK